MDINASIDTTEVTRDPAPRHSDRQDHASKKDHATEIRSRGT
jgi:hypothetical protein